MTKFAATAVTLALLGAPAFADGHATGDADAGEKVFNKCKACHMIQDADGNDIVKGGRTGPNLYGLYQRVAGSTDFRYGDSIVEAGEAGLEWNEEEFVKYVADPKEYLAEYLDDKKARSKMSFKLRKEEEAADVWAYIVSVGPEPKEEDGES
ncbi:c-type cytochrome [Sulfitobacter albidus]|uniref:C-type cytochrome n=1 Tax=Sulfitobacter albidus TaxID=2829501 RepID=A0A975JHS1_9RHOB|nr:c-type cytochrome [Sulfitobacter albidus]QUJ78416.1 c-type cytochrome [Sulfitobacter albidus]